MKENNKILGYALGVKYASFSSRLGNARLNPLNPLRSHGMVTNTAKVINNKLNAVGTALGDTIGRHTYGTGIDARGNKITTHQNKAAPQPSNTVPKPHAPQPPQPRVEGSYEDAQGRNVELLSDGTQRFRNSYTQ